MIELWRRWASRRAASREQAALQRRPIADDLWKRTLVRYSFLQRKLDPGATRLRRLTSLFLDRKEFVALGGLRLSNDVVVAVAAQACLPILELGLDAYDGFVGIVLHPDQVTANRSVTDEDGVVHEFNDQLAGEAVAGGPVMLSWRDVRSAGQGAASGYNVVVHEFAHVLDMARGLSDWVDTAGAGADKLDWQRTWRAEFERFQQQVDAGEATDLDPYGAEAPEEFFAVASEAFFVAPAMLQQAHPPLYEPLVAFFRQDPLKDMGGRPPMSSRTR